MKDLITWIQVELPYGGSWWKDGDEYFIECAEKMLKAGISEKMIKEIFEKLYNAVAAEYGD